MKNKLKIQKKLKIKEKCNGLICNKKYNKN